MKKEDIPQDQSALSNHFREIAYGKGQDGKYQKNLSTGWEVKASALDEAWKDIEDNVAKAFRAVQEGEKSPIYYYSEKCLMDLPTLSGYTGFFGFTIKRHMKPAVFKALSQKKLQKYADAFNVSLEELKSPKHDH